MSIKPNPSIIFKYSIERIAKHFKVIRLAFGCSLDEIAANLGYTRNTVSKYEDPTYIWKPHDYYALRCMFELLTFSIQDTEYYLEIWCRLIEGMTYKDGICVSEKYIDKLAARIAADAIEDLAAYVRQIEELRKDGYYLEKIEMTPYGHTIMTGPLPQPPMKVGKLHVGKNGVVSITEIPEEEVKE